jgi:hypothetical protein
VKLKDGRLNEAMRYTTNPVGEEILYPTREVVNTAPERQGMVSPDGLCFQPISSIQGVQK